MKKQPQPPTSYALTKFPLVSEELLPTPDYAQLTQEERDACEVYKKFLTKKGLPPDLLPLFPYYPVSVKYLTGNTNRIYIGKQSPGDKDDYLLITVPCRAAKEKDRIFYKDQIQPVKSGKDFTSYHILNFKKLKSGMKVTYRRVYEEQKPALTGYINNFLSFLKLHKLQKYFAFAFIVKKSKGQKLSHIRIRPTLFIEHGIFVQEDVVFEVCGSEAETCCQSPPEQGPSLDISFS